MTFLHVDAVNLLHQAHRILIDPGFYFCACGIAFKYIGCQLLSQSLRYLAAAGIVCANKSNFLFHKYFTLISSKYNDHSTSPHRYRNHHKVSHQFPFGNLKAHHLQPKKSLFADILSMAYKCENQKRTCFFNKCFHKQSSFLSIFLSCDILLSFSFIIIPACAAASPHRQPSKPYPWKQLSR